MSLGDLFSGMWRYPSLSNQFDFSRRGHGRNLAALLGTAYRSWPGMGGLGWRPIQSFPGSSYPNANLGSLGQISGSPWSSPIGAISAELGANKLSPADQQLAVRKQAALGY